MECPICCETIEVATTGIATMACNHSFHFFCLSKWFISQPDDTQSCPCCRREASDLEKVPVSEDFPEESEYDSEDDDDEEDDEENWPGRNDVYVPIPVETTTAYRLTGAWTRAPNGTWIRKATNTDAAPSSQPA